MPAISSSKCHHHCREIERPGGERRRLLLFPCIVAILLTPYAAAAVAAAFADMARRESFDTTRGIAKRAWPRHMASFQYTRRKPARNARNAEHLAPINMVHGASFLKLSVWRSIVIIMARSFSNGFAPVTASHLYSAIYLPESETRARRIFYIAPSPPANEVKPILGLAALREKSLALFARLTRRPSMSGDGERHAVVGRCRKSTAGVWRELAAAARKIAPSARGRRYHARAGPCMPCTMFIVANNSVDVASWASGGGIAFISKASSPKSAAYACRRAWRNNYHSKSHQGSKMCVAITDKWRLIGERHCHHDDEDAIAAYGGMRRDCLA